MEASRKDYAAILLLSLSALVFEINLTRLFSVAQFYHFAFMIVSLALLGSGASGAFLAIFPTLGRARPRDSLGWLALLCGLAMLAAYLLANGLPFDSFSIAWDRKQVAILVVHYIALALPFFFSGMATSLFLEAYPRQRRQVYAANLVGSALGCAVALALPALLGGEGMLLLSVALSAAAGMVPTARVSAEIQPADRPSLLSGRAGMGPETNRHLLWRRYTPGRRRICSPTRRAVISQEASRRGRRRVSDQTCPRPSQAAGKKRWLLSRSLHTRPTERRKALRFLQAALGMALLLFALAGIGSRIARRPWPFLDLRLSPYKGLSYALQYPGARVETTLWNAFSRVDRVTSAGIRSFPGMSYLYMQPLPPQDGIFVDGDDLSPVTRPGASMDFAAYMPAAVAYRLRPGARALLLEPRGGLDVLVARALGAANITAVESNPLVVEAAGAVYRSQSARVVIETDRSYLQRTDEQFDVIVFSLSSAYHPVRSGAYNLAEDYRHTVESFQDALRRLDGQGLLVVTRWLQTPPSEELRAYATGVEAIERLGGDPRAQIAALRGYNTLTLLLKRGPFTPAELRAVRQFAAERAYDLVAAPDMRPEEANQFNILPQPVYYQAFKELLEARPRAAFYAAYPYQVSPPTDDHPFFSHFFKWSQAGEVLSALGHTWQPFGGAGYFVILALLAVALVCSAALILAPVALAPAAVHSAKSGRAGIPARRSRKRGQAHSSTQDGAQGWAPYSLGPAAVHSAKSGRAGIPARRSRKRGQAHDRTQDSAQGWAPYKSSAALPLYFALIGFAYLLVEMPLIQRFILFLGQPAYAMAAVLFTLLLFSGLGSQWSHRLPARTWLAVLAALLLALPYLLPPIFQAALGLSLPLRLALTVLLLAPVGFLMGAPFPGGLRTFLGEEEHSPRLAWVWSINGAASVVAAVLAALLAITFGFNWVLRAGALCYAGAWVTVMGIRRPPPD